ncbi:putative endonuclease 4 [Grifola frondosa]|uniref:Putative endonuclease 4 n=1 Tax=Grifola frondosa TaxID=5627 RepID=A0A1C7M2H4_GRIFR|nr:putative endonuclease 4 [Grifola frondosa]
MIPVDTPLRRSSRLLASAGKLKPSSSIARSVTSNVRDRRSAQLRLSDSDDRPRPAKRKRTTKQHKEVNDVSVSDLSKATVAQASKVPKRKKIHEIEPTPEDFAPRVSNAWKIGPHVSSAGGVENSIINAASIGYDVHHSMRAAKTILMLSVVTIISANAFAIFLKSQRKWTSPPLTAESITAFKTRMKAFGYSPTHILPHGSYLVNLGNPDQEKREKSYQCFLDDLRRCEELGLLLYNFHPGSTVGLASPEESLSYIAECINNAHEETKTVVIVLENMVRCFAFSAYPIEYETTSKAGAGHVLGSNFSELGSIIQQVNDKSRVGVCLDTCHTFAAGYDITTKEGWDSTLAEFDREVGLPYLRGMHINDSKAILGSKKDRHENIGLGHLGLTTFAHIVTDPRTKDIPLILETPAFDRPGSGMEKKTDGELDQLKEWAAEIGEVVRTASGLSDARGRKKEGKTKGKGRAKSSPSKTMEDDSEDDGSSYGEDDVQ